VVIAALAAFAAWAPAVRAAAPPPPDSAAAGTAAAADTVATPSATAATRDYLGELEASFTPASRAYWRTRVVLSFVGPVWDGAIMLLLLFGGFSARFRDLAKRRGRNFYLQALIYVSIFIPAVILLRLPLDWFAGFWVEHHWGLSNQSAVAWLADQGKDVLVNVAFFGVLGTVAGAYRRMAGAPRHWWAWLGVVTLPVIVFVVLVQPVFVDPLYNRFQPLEDKKLEKDILALAARADIPARHVFQVDRSRQTKRYNAYVTGFGATQRIVLWDTIIAGMSRDELLFVMGHEMGHYRLGHIWKGIALYAVLSFALFGFAQFTATAAMRRFGGRWGFHALHDLASLPLMALVLGLAFQLALPVRNAFSRAVEHEADVFALEVTHDNDAGARAFLKLAEQNLANPDPPEAIEILRYTHPSPADRIRFALAYRPWEHGEPNRVFVPRAESPSR